MFLWISPLLFAIVLNNVQNCKSVAICPKSSKVPYKFIKPKEFIITGHAGGDPWAACENTFKATEAGLNNGANAIEIDLSISADGVIFLWHDPSPLHWTSILRRNGFTLPGRCIPVMKNNKKSEHLTYDIIKSNWFWADLKSNGEQINVITLHDWLNIYANDTRIKLFALDVKVAKESMCKFVKILMAELNDFSMGDLENVIFHALGSDRAKELNRCFLMEGIETNRIISDKVPWIKFFIKPNDIAYDAFSPANPENHQDLCSCCASLGVPFLTFNKENPFNGIVQYNKAMMNIYRNTNESAIFVWTIDDEKLMKQSIKNGVNGLTTNKPKLLKSVLEGSSQ